MPKFAYDNIRKALEAALPGSLSNKGVPLALGPTGSGGNGVVYSRSGLFGNEAAGKDFTDTLVNPGGEVLEEAVLPEDRLMRYPFLEEMVTYPTLAAALNIHISYAFSIDKTTNLSFRLKPIGNSEDKDFNIAQALCDELMNDIGRTINQELPGWATIMAVFGTGYVRPHTKPKVGITGFECNYYTLPYFIREYEVGGQLAGFTGDYLKDANGALVFAKPWEMVPMRIPYWRPRKNQMPMYTGTEQFSLLSDPEKRVPVETQNYGTSLFEHAYEPYLNLRTAIRSVKATRFNASKIDRLIGVQMSSLDPARAAEYSRTLSQQLKRSADQVEKRARGHKTAPTVTNTLLPIMGADGKGTLQIDTQSIPVDITAIEDVMFHIKQLAASVGIDYTMLGFADQMSGGLGEGGFLRTSIQAGMIASWLRGGATELIYRMCDIHLAFKYGKVYPPGQRPYEVEFNSMATSIEQEENAAMDGRANYASVLVTIIDAICNNPSLAKSETFKQLVMGDILKVPQERLTLLLKEIKSAPSTEGNNMMESLGITPTSAISDSDLIAIMNTLPREELQDALISAFTNQEVTP
ncbi:phage portal protein [Chimaeribacter californicus]|uniref:phage portal protein n=1 Tax=Chimaeribacter californicus TaxID=2060067 RepID=UPI0015898F49|nr:phage portal protein [Chimaeribacter californicus]